MDRYRFDADQEPNPAFHFVASLGVLNRILSDLLHRIFNILDSVLKFC
jgi:hypothetical protein